MKTTMMLLLLFFSYTASIAGVITVAAAANVHYAVEELCNNFRKERGVEIRSIVASSGKLTAQIERGAPFDIFLSANMKYPEYLKERGFALNEPKVYATGSIVLWTLKGVDIEEGLLSLRSGSVRQIAIPNPNSAPYGMEALKALKAAGVFSAVKRKLVYAESVSQTNRYIASKSVDAGITAKSVVLSPRMAGKGRYVEVDRSLYDPIEQGVVVLKHAKSAGEEEVRAFYDYIFSPEAKAVFKKYGYGVK